MEPHTLTPEQQEDVDTRVAEFMKRYHENVEELQVDLIRYPQYIQVGPEEFATRVSLQPLDKKYMPVPSPLANEGGEIVDA